MDSFTVTFVSKNPRGNVLGLGPGFGLGLGLALGFGLGAGLGVGSGAPSPDEMRPPHAASAMHEAANKERLESSMAALQASGGPRVRCPSFGSRPRARERHASQR